MCPLRVAISRPALVTPSTTENEGNPGYRANMQSTFSLPCMDVVSLKYSQGTVGHRAPGQSQWHFMAPWSFRTQLGTQYHREQNQGPILGSSHWIRRNIFLLKGHPNSKIYCPPGNEDMSQGGWEDDFPFPKVGYVSFQEHIYLETWCWAAPSNFIRPSRYVIWAMPSAKQCTILLRPSVFSWSGDDRTRSSFHCVSQIVFWKSFSYCVCSVVPLLFHLLGKLR